MRNESLDPHEAIAWDVDQTLINGPNSEFFCRYIRGNPHKRHFVVTFRTPHSWAEQALEQIRENGVDPRFISGVSSVPEHLFEAFAQRHVTIDAARLLEFNHWKGMEAARLGCSVLVDDMEEHVILGCQRHRVKFLHSLNHQFELQAIA